MKARVVIAQPYVPKYRVAFFESLRHRLGQVGIDCVVAAGVPQGDQAARSDAVSPDWLVPVRTMSLSIVHRSIDFAITPAPWKHTDAVILGLEGSSLPVYQALLTGTYSNLRVGLWGHVRPYVAASNPLDLWLEKQQMRAADHVFAYTPGGRNYALASGIEPEKVTTVMNSLDTSALEESKRRLTSERVRDFATRWEIDPKRALCFVGGLDESKRIRFLADVLDILWQKDRSVRLLIGGEGPQKSLLKPAFDRGQAIDLGYLDANDKALVMCASRGVAMPGRIGLIAVDALVMQRPIITTNWSYHAPEAEYLIEGQSRFTSQDTPEAYSSAIVEFLNDLPRDSNFSYPPLANMVDNFASGVVRMLES